MANSRQHLHVLKVSSVLAAQEVKSRPCRARCCSSSWGSSASRRRGRRPATPALSSTAPGSFSGRETSPMTSSVRFLEMAALDRA